MVYRTKRIVEENLNSTILTPHSPTLGDLATLEPEKWKQADTHTRLDALNQLSEQYTNNESRKEVNIEIGIQHTNAKAKEFHEAIGFRPTKQKILVEKSLIQENDPYKATATVLEALHLHYKMSAVSDDIKHPEESDMKLWKNDLNQRKKIVEKGLSKEQVKREIYNLSTMQDCKQFADDATKMLRRVHTLTLGQSKQNTLKDNPTNFTQPLPEGEEKKKNKALAPNQPAEKSQPTQTKKPEEELEQKKEKKRGRSLSL